MNKLKLLDCDPEDHLDLIVGSKRGANRRALDAALSRIARRYRYFKDRYTVNGLATVRAGSWSDDEEAALLHCYNSEVEALTELKRLIKETQPLALRSICPYCGIGDPVQFDHYVPKSKFPEFAVHAYNLVPCCGPCNGLKSETWLVGGARVFVNFYLDSLPTASMLETTVSWRTYRNELVPSMSFKLVRPRHFGVSRFSLIERHFDRLDLLGRYSSQAPSEMFQFLDSSRMADATTRTRMRASLQRYIDRREERLGPLHWKLSLYRALVADETFLDMCLA
ncbi:Uncharacterised protein [Burkholderia pseudomallei]|nr:Uncharacterised protein [Burkholderia pseudomallei]